MVPVEAEHEHGSLPGGEPRQRVTQDQAPDDRLRVVTGRVQLGAGGVVGRQLGPRAPAAPGVHRPVVHHLPHERVGVALAHESGPPVGDAGQGLLEQVLRVLYVAGEEVRRTGERR